MCQKDLLGGWQWFEPAEQFAASGVPAVLLPGTSYFLGMKHWAPGRRMYKTSMRATAMASMTMSAKPTRSFIARSAAGANIVEIGLGDDLDICCDVDRHDIVATMNDQAITRAGA